MALAATTDAAQLESLASLDPAQAGQALLAARNMPDLWTGSEAIRRKVAGEVFAGAKAPTGDFQRDSVMLETAMFLSPDRSRSLMESLIAKRPRYGDRDYLVRFAGAFSDQPDVRDLVYELGGAWNLSADDCELALDQGVLKGALPGRQLHPATVQALFDVVGNPAKMEWSRQQAVNVLVKSGISESTLSDEFSRLWNRPLSNQQRLETIINVSGGVYWAVPSEGPMRGTRPDRFLAGVLRDTGEPLLQAVATTALYAGGPSSPDPLTQGQLDSFLRLSLASTLGNLPDSRSYFQSYLYSTYVSHLAVHGTPAEIPGLSRKALDFIPRGLDEAQREKVSRQYQDEMNFAIDAIRLRAN